MSTGKSRKVGESVRRRAVASAFTLVELLVVIALSTLLLALLFGPIIQGFRLTNRARAMVAAQSSSRYGIEQFTRELQQAAYVFDNANSPIAIPLEAPQNADGTTSPAGSVTRGNTYQQNSGGNAIVVPLEAFGRIDLVPSAILTGSGVGIDPTTNHPIGGGDLRVPTGPGNRYVRYWVGLRRNYNGDSSAGGVSKAYYQNVYEFPRSDNDLNAFVLWRAEYDPSDPNLVNQTAQSNQTGTGANTYTFDGGGLNDPDFFYNLNSAQNNRSYAENWRAIANPVVSGANLDLIFWRRTSGRRIDTGNPFTLGASFSPGTIVGDTATPGFLSAGEQDAPGAVPTLYTTQYGGWSLPFSLTVYRASTHYSTAANSPSGTITLTFTTDNKVMIDNRSGRLQPADTEGYYVLRSPNTGRYFVALPNLTFWLDPARGRIETGVVPVAGNVSGSTSSSVFAAPQFFDSTGQIKSMAAGPTINVGEVVETVFRESTLDTANAGNTNNTSATVPVNQGILFADLAPLDTTGPGNYYDVTGVSTTPMVSPFSTFGLVGDTTNYRGAMIVPGSEKVYGPPIQIYQAMAGSDPNVIYPTPTNATVTNDVLYSRFPAAYGVPKITAGVMQNGLYVRTGPLNYSIEGGEPYGSFKRPLLQFDYYRGFTPRNASGAAQTPDPSALVQTPAPGLPARPASSAGADRQISVTYLWQNNYARSAEGRPIDVNGKTELLAGGSIRPEADVIKVNYLTRSLMNAGLGVRVYDSSTGQPQTSQVADKVRVNNVGR